MRAVLLILLLVLAGCSSWSKPPVPKQPEAPTDGSIVDKVGTQLDKVDGRVAAAVTVARDNADKPEIVKAETGVALSYLPVPSPADVAYAEKRASKIATPDGAKTYKDAEAYGKKLQAEVEAGWAKMEAQQKEAKRVSDLKDRRIEDLEKQLVDKDRAWESKMWTALGAALVIFGGFIGWLAKSPKGASIFIGLGFACGAYPRVVESPWFGWVVGGAIALCALIGLFMLWQRYRNKPVAEVNVEPQPPTLP
jgi:hypothetical protein